MKFLAIAASPRRGGNSDTLLDALIAGARSEGAEVDKIYVYDLSSNHCKACGACNATGVCIQFDDIALLHDKALKADRVIIASPVHFLSVPAHLKIIVDRSQPFWILKHFLSKPVISAARIAQRKGFLITTAASPSPDIFTHLIPVVKSYFNTIECPYAGCIKVNNLEGPADISRYPEKIEEARQKGKELANDG